MNYDKYDGGDRGRSDYQGGCEALTGADAGEVLSREIRSNKLPTLLSEAEGNTPEGVKVSQQESLRGRRPSASKLPGWELGYLSSPEHRLECPIHDQPPHAGKRHQCYRDAVLMWNDSEIVLRAWTKQLTNIAGIRDYRSASDHKWTVSRAIRALRLLKKTLWQVMAISLATKELHKNMIDVA